MQSIFFRSVAAILCVTSGAKFLSLTQDIPILKQSDPLMPFLTNSQVVIIAASLELLVVWLLWRRNLDFATKGDILLGLSLAFTSYRIGLEVLGARFTCKCFGNVLQWVGLSAVQEFWISTIVLSAFFLGSILFKIQPRLVSSVSRGSEETVTS